MYKGKRGIEGCTRGFVAIDRYTRIYEATEGYTSVY